MGIQYPSAVESQPSRLIGQSIGHLELATGDSESVQIVDYLGEQLGFVYVATSEDCLGCGDYANELKLLKRYFPSSRTVLLGVGDNMSDLQGYVGRHRIEGLFDVNGALANSLGGARTPLFFMLSSTGTILYVDSRTGPQSSSQPISELVRTVRDLLVDSS